MLGESAGRVASLGRGLTSPLTARPRLDSQERSADMEKATSHSQARPASPGSGEAATPLWEFVPLADYGVPDMPASSAAANAWAAFKHLFRHDDDEMLTAVKKEADLRALSEIQLAHLAPPPDWRAAALALDVALHDRHRATPPNGPVSFVIGQPHAGHDDIVKCWGEMHQAIPIAPPSPADILTGNGQWLDNWPATDQLWVLPNLEHCYLRHTHGLALVRQLLEGAESGRLGRGIIGCDSWAWAYLQRIWPVPKPEALTLQAFDGDRLSRLFASLEVSRPGRHIRFRNAENGKGILSVPAAEDESAVGAEIIQLAAHCRGNVGTAQHYWRERLRAEPEAEVSESDSAADQAPGEESVWVTVSLPEPVLPTAIDEDAVLMLHALLLHGGLPEALLPELLPYPATRCMAVLLCLRNAGIIDRHQERWKIAKLAYTTVRSLLRGRDYLTDDF
jgi:hypothetical protein